MPPIQPGLSDGAIMEGLRKKGYRATSQRIAICRFALRGRNHPTAQRIYGEVKRVHPTVSLATVYKTLHVLNELHLVQELPFVEGETRFDSCVRPHANLVCRVCGNISDVDDHATQKTDHDPRISLTADSYVSLLISNANHDRGLGLGEPALCCSERCCGQRALSVWDSGDIS
jgi:Fe2+ or Zn2+ uptake regulation protein